MWFWFLSEVFSYVVDWHHLRFICLWTLVSKHAVMDLLLHIDIQLSNMPGSVEARCSGRTYLYDKRVWVVPSSLFSLEWSSVSFWRTSQDSLLLSMVTVPVSCPEEATGLLGFSKLTDKLPLRGSSSLLECVNFLEGDTDVPSTMRGRIVLEMTKTMSKWWTRPLPPWYWRVYHVVQLHHSSLFPWQVFTYNTLMRRKNDVKVRD